MDSLDLDTNPAYNGGEIAGEFSLPPEPNRPDVVVGKVLRTDPTPPPATLLESSETTFGTDPIPVSRYISREFSELEKQKLWPKVWQFACWSYDIPNPGDIHVYRMLDRSVLIVRQRDGSIKALINACLHRGRELCETHTNQAELRCPYHAFTWGLGGDLKWTPSKWDFPQIDEANFRLPEIRVEIWNGFVFVNFDKDAMPLEKYLGRMVEQWSSSGWDFSTRYKAVHVRKRIRCNWKAGQDGFIEGMHTFASHPQFIATVPDDSSQQDVYVDEPHISRFTFLAAIPSHRLQPKPSEQEIFEALCADFLPEALGTEEGIVQPGETARTAIARIAARAYVKNFGIDVSKYTVSELIDPVSYAIFPNFMPWPTLSFPLAYHFLPDEDPDWCIWDTMMFLPFSGERPPSAEMIELREGESFETVLALGKMGLIAEQDAVQLPAVQRGMRNLQSGVLTLTEYQEVRIRHYHRTLSKYLGVE
jgi:nitrite reductase/ring-hydroxylating ferredoxin subunit